MLFALKRPGDDLSAWLPLRISPIETVIETEPNDVVKQASAAKIPGALHGVIGKPGDRDHFRVSLKKGQLYQVQVETHTIGSPADIELILLDPAGKEVTRADDSGLEEARMNITPPADGDYTLVVNWSTGAVPSSPTRSASPPAPPA